jgi:3-hydroxyacyl-CoA dehydrogenase
VLDAASGRIKDELAMLPHLPQYAHHAFRIEPPADHQALLERIGIADALGTAVEGADLVIEAVREDLATKQTLFADSTASRRGRSSRPTAPRSRRV